MIAESAVPSLARGVRLREDAARGGWVLLAPERVHILDAQALAVLRLVDGVRLIGGIIDSLAAIYDAPRAVIAADITGMLEDLAAQGCLRLGA